MSNNDSVIYFDSFVFFCRDKLFPALGFGARLPPDGRVSHEFFLVRLNISEKINTAYKFLSLCTNLSALVNKKKFLKYPINLEFDSFLKVHLFLPFLCFVNTTDVALYT